MRWWWMAAFAVPFVAACVETSTTTCGELICPDLTVCVPALGGCFNQDAVDACDGQPDGAGCDTPNIAVGNCMAGVCIPQGCGDGTAAELEECDGSDLRGMTCGDLGYYDPNSVLGCAADCTYDESGCNEFCGDGITNGPELCDGDDVPFDCSALGFYQPDGAACSSFCTPDSSGCSERCGDGVLNGPELCDGAPPTSSCVDLGFDRGRSLCSPICGVDFSQCGYIGWRPEELSNSILAMFDVDRTPSGFGITAGGVGQYTVFDGTTWNLSTTGGDSQNRVWVYSDTEAFTVGFNGSIYHWDGATMTPMVSGTTEQLVGVGGSSPTDVYAVGFSGTVLHYDGNSWTDINDLGVTDDLLGVFVLDPQHVYIVGRNGRVMLYNGAGWIGSISIGSIALFALYASSPTDLWAVGEGGVVHFNGSIWAPVVLGAWTMTDIDGIGSDRIFAVGAKPSQQPVMAYYDGDSWSLVDPGVDILLLGVDVNATDVVIVGTAPNLSGAIARSTGLAWADVSSPPSTRIEDLVQLSPAEIFGVGGDAVPFVSVTPAVGHWINGTWTVTDVEPSLTDDELTAVWAASATDLIAVGTSGLSYRYNGTDWNPLNVVSPASLFGVWGTSASNVYAVGASDTVLHFDGSSWTVLSSGSVTAVLRGVWGTADDDIWVVGNGGVIRHFDGMSWTSVPSGTTETLKAVWGTSADNVLAVGEGGTIVRWNGVAWSPDDSYSQQDLEAVHGTGPDDIFAVGATTKPTILHYDGVSWSPIRSTSSAISGQRMLAVDALQGRVLVGGTFFDALLRF